MSGPTRPLDPSFLPWRGNDETRTIVCISPLGKLLYSYPFAARDSSLGLYGDSIYLGIADAEGDKTLIRIDMKEE